jgi:hypothetical protein
VDSSSCLSCVPGTYSETRAAACIMCPPVSRVGRQAGASLSRFCV